MQSSLHRLAVSVSAVSLCVALSAPALADIVINEVDSQPADFIELKNTGAAPVDVTNYVLRDNGGNSMVIPANPPIPAGGYLSITPSFGLGNPDGAQLFLPGGVTLVDSFSYIEHALNFSYGRCPDGTGIFLTTTSLTSGAANTCISPLPQRWPGSASVTGQSVALGADTSGLDYEGTGTSTPGVLWVVNNGGSRLDRLLWNGTQWVRDTNNGWAAGKTLQFAGGAALADSEGVTVTDAGSAGGVFVSSERDLNAAGTSRISVLRYDVSGAAVTLDATNEWNLTPDIVPGVPANGGAESVEWVPDTYLVGSGFVDVNTGQPYDPADYANHGTGLFFVGIEGNGNIYVYALDQTSSAFTRIASFASGFSTFGALHFDPDNNQLWVVCDNNCDGRARVFEVNSAGVFGLVSDFVRPANMLNYNNEGFTFTPDSECVGGVKPVYWADDGNIGGTSIRVGTITCRPPLGLAGWSAPTTAKGDFNGDGFGDLAIGAPGENNGAGAVHVLFGGAVGITTVGSQFWSQDSAGIADTAEAGDDFGRSLAVGNFNSDGFNDLAIGAPGENLGAGTVHVLYGSAAGLTATGSQQWSQASTGVPDDAETGDHFGATLAAGNLDTSTVASELVIGAPDEDLGTWINAGVVHVLKGTSTGLKGTYSQIWSQYSPGIADNPSPGDRFGSSLAVGDLGGSVAHDLAIGVPEEDGAGTVDSGVVHVLLGSATGLTATGSTLWSQASTGIGDSPETGDAFGASLAIGNIGGSAFGDLIVGVPGEDIGAAGNAGIVQTIPGSGAGPTGAGSQTFSQAGAAIAGDAEDDDEFGYALAVGDFGGDSFLDLAVGAPGESGVSWDYGVVHLIPGSAAGLTATGSQMWSQNSAGVGDTAEANDRFGAALAAGNYGGSAHWDLAIGAPGESIGALSSAGIVTVLPGSAAFLTATGSATFSQDTAGIADSSEASDALGLALGR